ncbi:MAG TPA: hypothetical protein VKX17_21425 [Planctomycetota bacterium]|nr:hypothetical protein [Planctomycetota bacterium]
MPETDDERTQLVPPGMAAGPGETQRLMRMGGETVKQCAALTGWDIFEHMLLYCLKLLDQADGKICAFYIDDFDDCDEYTLGVIQKLIGRAGYTTSDFRSGAEKTYRGFWAWRTKT